MFAIFKTILALVGLLALIILGIYLGRGIVDGGEEDLDFFRTVLAGRVAGEMLDDLESKPSIKSLSVIVPAGEKHEHFKRFLVNALQADGLVVASAEKVKEGLKQIFKGKLEVIKTDEQAETLAKLIGSDATLVGDLKEFSRPRGGVGAGVDFNVRMVQPDAQSPLLVKRYQSKIGSKFSPVYLQGAIHESSPWMRIFLWVIFALLFPFATLAIVKRTLRKESNVHNGIMLAGYTGIDLFAALALTGFYISGFFVWVLLFVALAGGALYNFVALTKIEELSH